MSGRKDYEERKEHRKEIYQERAVKLKQEADRRANSNAHRILSIAPGQPILVGHHSERTARRLHRQAEYDTRKSIELDKKSTYYADRAENIDNNNVISSDDPQAIEKLKHKLEILEKQKIQIKAREHDWYELPYINADIKRVKEKIQELQDLEELQFEDIIFQGGRATVNKDLNRVQLIFDDIPSEDIRTLLKKHGFHWSRYQGAWQRLYSKNGITAVRIIVDRISKGVW